MIRAAGVQSKTVFKVNEGRPNAVDLLKAGSLDLIIYTATSGAHAFSDEKSIRRNAVTYRVPCITTMSGAKAAVEAIAIPPPRPHPRLELAGDPWGPGREDVGVAVDLPARPQTPGVKGACLVGNP